MSTLSQFLPHAKVLGQMVAVTENASWQPAYTGWYYICLIGGGGSGAKVINMTSSGHALGGNAGSTVIAVRYLDSAVTYSLTVGGGGAAAAGTGGSANGNDGSTTQMTGTGLTSLVATGGKGGVYQTVAGSITLSSSYDLSNGDNTTPTGGDLNLVGGQGGAIDINASVAIGTGPVIATGGGAVRISSLIAASMARGGNAIFNTGYDFGVSTYSAATGGGGVRGAGGDVTYNTNLTSLAHIRTYGGGGGGAATGGTPSNGDASNTAAADRGEPGPGTTGNASSIESFASATGRGGKSVYVSASVWSATEAGFGGGGFGALYSLDEIGTNNKNSGGAFGGGGGVAVTNVSNATYKAGSGGVFGGGGGGLAWKSSSYLDQIYTGAGGNGVILIAQAAGPFSGGI